MADAVEPVVVRESAVHGRGVFAARRFRAGDVVEDCPVLVLPAGDIPHLEQTELYGYYFEWEDDGVGLALGLGSLYNHSSTPNAEVEADHDDLRVRYVALADIDAGEEVTIDYTGGKASVELWFDAVEPRRADRRRATRR